tara:strand:+ start:196 stop:498 length:303 start_codon:yes stop_codon:yes gene_type:complete
MAITYSWNIRTVDRTIATGGINTIHWRCNAVEGDHSVGSYGAVGCTPNPSASDFIDYDSVTEANCIAWVQADVSKDDTEAALAAQIAVLKTPITGSGTPW